MSCPSDLEALTSALSSHVDLDDLGFLVSTSEFLSSSRASFFGTSTHGFVILDRRLGVTFSFATSVLQEASSLLRRASGPETADMASRAAVLLNGDHYTAWNTRKRLLLRGGSLEEKRRLWDEEMALSDLVLSKHVKSGESWAHRRWLLARERGVAAENAKERLEKEVRVCERAAERYRNNYYAWTHRAWLLETLESLEERSAWLEEELERTRSWIRGHVSQRCAGRFLENLLERKREAGSDIRWCEEMEFVTDLIEFYPGHESLWMFRRFVWEKVALETQDGDALKDLVLEEIRQVRRKCIQLESVENFQDQRTFASTYLLFVIRKSGAAGNVEFLRGHWDRLVEDLIRWNPYQKHLWNGLSSVTFVPLLKGNTKEVYST